MSTVTRNRSGAKRRGQAAEQHQSLEVLESPMTSTYVVSTGLHGEAKTVVRNPHSHDVLSGRGGGINSHPGNKAFREWVRMRKNEYNLATSKVEKARVSREIVDRIKNLDPPGRFLAKDPDANHHGPSFGNMADGWVEISDDKAMQKTSQALREGAPRIRADHAGDEKGSRKRPAERQESTRQNPSLVLPAAPSRPSSSTRRTRGYQALSPASAAAVDALKRNAEAAKREAELEERKAAVMQSIMHVIPTNEKRVENDSKAEDAVDPKSTAETPPPEEETPPLKPVPADLISWTAIGMPHPVRSNKADMLIRTNSLALDESDKDSNYLGVPFVNPFEDEFSEEPSNKKRRLSRSLSESSSSHGDLAGIGALMDDDSKNEVRDGKIGSLSRKSSRSLSSTSTSELSDLAKVCSHPSTDFEEGMRAVFDAAHPGLASAWSNDVIPTHLYPFQERKKKTRRRTNTYSSTSGSASGLHNWESRQ